MNSIITAIATDNEALLIDRHFGDARKYVLYSVTAENFQYLKTVTNTIDEEETHADPEKAGGITRLLRQEGVNAVVSRQFGPNIKRIRRSFVCIVTDCKTVESTGTTVQQHLPEIAREWACGEERSHLRIKCDS